MNECSNNEESGSLNIPSLRLSSFIKNTGTSNANDQNRAVSNRGNFRVRPCPARCQSTLLAPSSALFQPFFPAHSTLLPHCATTALPQRATHIHSAEFSPFAQSTFTAHSTPFAHSYPPTSPPTPTPHPQPLTSSSSSWTAASRTATRQLHSRSTLPPPCVLRV